MNGTPVEHFMGGDALGMVLGTLLFAPFLLTPGYLFGWTFDLLGFRGQTRSWRALLSLVFSVAIAPIVTFLLGAFVSDRALWGSYAVACLFCAGAMIFFRTKAERGSVPRWAAWAVIGWAVVVWVSEIDLQFGKRLYPSVLAFDFNLRTAFIDGIARHGLPAVNPVFFPGHSVLLRYHYFWFIPIALVDRLGGALVTARHALTGGNVWCGWAMMAIVALYLRFFHPAGERGLNSRIKWALGLLVVAGLDVLPNLFLDVANHLSGLWVAYPSAEWWNDPVTGFAHGVLFEAHQFAGLIACLAGFLLLWQLPACNGAYRKWGAAFCAGLCFASGAGLSIYISFTFALVLTGWCVVILVRRGWREVAPWAASGVTALLFAAPYLSVIGKTGGTGGPFVLPTIRSFTPFDTLLPAFGFSWNQVAVANLLVLPLNYFLETGVWFMLALLWWSRTRRRGWRSTDVGRATLLTFVICFLVGTFLRNGVILNYDLAWRSLLPAQFVLLLWSVEPVRAWWRCRSSKFAQRPAALGRWRFRIATLLVIGLASTVYDFTIMRFFFPLADAGVFSMAKWFSHDNESGKRTFAVRQGYQQLDQIVPGSSVLQANPYYWDDIYHGLYGQRQTASFDYLCGAVMGGDPADCERMQAQLVPLFNDPTLSRALDIDQVCEAWGIDVLVGKDSDPIFQDRGTWLWTRAALVENDRFRAVPCGSKKLAVGTKPPR